MLIRRPGKSYHRAAIVVMALNLAGLSVWGREPIFLAVAAGVLAASLATIGDRIDEADARYRVALDRVGRRLRPAHAGPGIAREGAVCR